MSMERVARRAGVGKDTLYRRWPSKLALVRDGILRGAVGAVPLPETEDPRQDLVTYLTDVAEFADTTAFGSIVAGIVGEAYRNPELASAFHEFVGGRRRCVELLLDRIRGNGSFEEGRGTEKGLDLELELDLLLAPLYYRRLVSGAQVDAAFFEALVDRLLALE